MKLDHLISELQNIRAESADGDIDVLFETPNENFWYDGFKKPKLTKITQEDLFEHCILSLFKK